MASNNAIISVSVLVLAVFLQTETISALDRSDIYCTGKLLEAVQMSALYNDSKTFVDMKMRQSADEIMDKFNDMMNDINNTSSYRMPSVNATEAIKRFVDEHFEPTNSEFVNWIPDDWKDYPEFLEKIKNDDLRGWAKKLHDMWRDLGRKMNPDIERDEERYSIIYVEKPVIIPGGRFREFYYWDSYWIVQGLLVSQMNGTVKGMLENFMGLVDRYGFVPNGGRIYYTGRSQPPLLTPMVQSYYEATGDKQFLREHADTLAKELHFWLDNRMTNVTKGGRSYEVAVYKQSTTGPRPESYLEDMRSSNGIDDADKDDFYVQIKSAAESGWDFSSRWFVRNATNEGNLTNLRTSSIVPVDLNAILQWNARLISDFYHDMGLKNKSEEYAAIAYKFSRVLDELLWNDRQGVWMDYDMENETSREYFYASNLVPLWTQSHLTPRCSTRATTNTEHKTKVERVLRYLDNPYVNISAYPGGVPTSLTATGEQWDFPNAWAPLQHMVILGLYNTENAKARELSLDLCQKWVYSNYKAFNDTNNMYEKYNASQVGKPGDGGEYEVQLGFGWTNGVILDLLNRHGDVLSADPNSLAAENTIPNGPSTR